MTEHDSTDDATAHSSTERHHDRHRGRHGELVTAIEDEREAVLVYDRENPDAWVQSDAAVALAEVR